MANMFNLLLGGMYGVLPYESRVRGRCRCRVKDSK
jgi:hypothetical protein